MALTTLDIQNQLVKYKNFKGVYAIDKLPLTLFPKPFGIVINLDPSWKSGSHWTAVFIPIYGSGIYFDSYGQQPPEMIK
uniref:Ubiquitin-like protease family profile domain-containing protein n=1 Tax=Tetranychus urticae TaxID=32264 RepID=A0A158P5G0_TETUR